MSGKKKTVWKAFGYQSCDDFAAYLNHMARKGWHFRGDHQETIPNLYEKLIKD